MNQEFELLFGNFWKFLIVSVNLSFFINKIKIKRLVRNDVKLFDNYTDMCGDAILLTGTVCIYLYMVIV